MSLGVCRTCEKPIAMGAVRCPHCGETKPAKQNLLFLPMSHEEYKNTKIEQERFKKFEKNVNTVMEDVSAVVDVLGFIGTIIDAATGGPAKRERERKEREEREERERKEKLERKEREKRLKIAKALTGSELNVDAINELLLSPGWMFWSFFPFLAFATWIHVYYISKDKINLIYAFIYAFIYFNFIFSGKLILSVWVIGIVHMFITRYLVERTDKRKWIHVPPSG